ncbi:MAG: hypothetical protein WB425_18680, partial [Terracidiphilus sp.]
SFTQQNAIHHAHSLMFALKFAMKTTPTAYATVVPIPTLLPETEIGELPTVEVPVKTGTVFVVPLPVTDCAAALIANDAMQIATAAILLCIVFLILS